MTTIQNSFPKDNQPSPDQCKKIIEAIQAKEQFFWQSYSFYDPNSYDDDDGKSRLVYFGVMRNLNRWFNNEITKCEKD